MPMQPHRPSAISAPYSLHRDGDVAVSTDFYRRVRFPVIHEDGRTGEVELIITTRRYWPEVLRRLPDPEHWSDTADICTPILIAFREFS